MKKVENIARSSPEEVKEPFNAEMEKFVQKASTEVKHLAQYVEECSKKFIDCLSFYKFTPKKGKLEDVKPADFFAFWYIFCEDYKNIWKKEQVWVFKSSLSMLDYSFPSGEDSGRDCKGREKETKDEKGLAES